MTGPTGWTLTSFTADQRNIRYILTGLEFATNLPTSRSGAITTRPDWTVTFPPSPYRVNLTHLDVSFNQITNAAAVAGLTNLVYLDLGGRNVEANNIGIRDTAHRPICGTQWLSLHFLGGSDLGGLTGPTALTNLT